MYNNRIGVIYHLEDLIDNGPDKLFDLGVECVQLQVWDINYSTEENANKVLEMLGNKVKVTSVWGGWSGPQKWDFIDGPVTLGLTPPAYRDNRLRELKIHAEFASKVGSPYLTTHMGFMPEQPCYPEYRGIVRAVQYLGEYCKSLGIGLNFETGQETPVTLMRVLKDTGCDNVGINLDPANLIMYGRANPVDALDIFGEFIKGVHLKDGNYPKDDFYKLGKEVLVGTGSVNYPVFLPKLLKNGYMGDLYVEREIPGEQQIIDIKKTIKYVKDIISNM